MYQLAIGLGHLVTGLLTLSLGITGLLWLVLGCIFRELRKHWRGYCLIALTAIFLMVSLHALNVAIVFATDTVATGKAAASSVVSAVYLAIETAKTVYAIACSLYSSALDIIEFLARDWVSMFWYGCTVVGYR